MSKSTDKEVTHVWCTFCPGWCPIEFPYPEKPLMARWNCPHFRSPRYLSQLIRERKCKNKSDEPEVTFDEVVRKELPTPIGYEDFSSTWKDLSDLEEKTITKAAQVKSMYDELVENNRFIKKQKIELLKRMLTNLKGVTGLVFTVSQPSEEK